MYVFRYFTIAEANESLPEVAEKFQAILSHKEAVTKIERQLQECAMNGASLESYMTLKQDLNAALIQFYRSVATLESTGVLLKGLDEGLVDFPSKRFNEDVWLCWKSGEATVRFWHETDSGFMGRKPLEVSDESLV